MMTDRGPEFIIPSHHEVAREYRGGGGGGGLRKYVCRYVHMFTFCHRSSAYIYQWILI